MWWLCLALCAVATAQESTTKADFGFGISDSFFNGTLNAVILPAVDQVLAGAANNVPPNCCYSKLDTKVQLTNMNVPESSIHSSALVSSDANGLKINLNIGFTVDLHLKVCLQVAKSCGTLFGCNNDVALDVELTSLLLLAVSADEAGHLTLSAPNATLAVNIPSFGSLCAFVKGIILDVLKTVNQDLNKIFPDIVNLVLKDLSKTLNSPIQIGNIFTVQLLFNPDSTGTSNLGISLSGDFVVTSDKTGKVSPFVPSAPIPNLLYTLGPNSEELILTDAAINNVIYAFYETLPHKIDVPVYLQGNRFDFHIDVRRSPEITFSATTGSSITLQTRNVIQNGFVRIMFDLKTTLYFALRLYEGKLYIELSPTNFDFDITLIPPVNFDNFTGSIDDVVHALYVQYIPLLNDVAKEHALKLPHVPFFAEPQTIVQNGYVILSVQNKNPYTPSVAAAPFVESENAAAVGVFSLIGKKTRNLFLELFFERLAASLAPQTAQSVSATSAEEVVAARDFFCPSLPGFSHANCPAN